MGEFNPDPRRGIGQLRCPNNKVSELDAEGSDRVQELQLFVC